MSSTLPDLSSLSSPVAADLLYGVKANGSSEGKLRMDALPINTATQTALNLKANTASLAAVALSGAYADLSGTPTLPSGAIVGTTDTQTLTGKTINGSSNTLSNLPASGILGVIPIANLATGTPNGSKFVADDGTLKVPGGVGGGTVTQVSVVTANGVSGSVANDTTTPAITLSLGAITPSSVNGVTLSGSSTPTLAVTGTSSISGANTGDQTSVTGNAGTATALQTARNINGVSFNGTANITVPAAAETLTGSALPALSGANLTALNASNLGSGTVPDARFPSTLPAVSGVNLTAINASNLGSGTVPAARMPALTGPVSTSAGAVATTLAWEISVACSDISTAITAGTKKAYFPAPFDGVLTEVFVTVDTAPTGSTAIFDVNKNGTTMLSTRVSIDAGETSSLTAATPPVISVSTFSKGDIISVDFDQVGSTIAGAWVIAVFKGTRTS